MIRRLAALDGVLAVSRFRDDGAFVEGFGDWPVERLEALARFAHDYKRIVQGNADQLSMFTGVRGWVPPRGWVVRGAGHCVCSAGNLVCVMDPRAGDLDEVVRTLEEAARY